PPWGRCSALSGMHEGTVSSVPPGASQVVTLLLSQPHPGPDVTPGAGTGLSPVKLSKEAIAGYRCPPHDGESAIENVVSEMSKLWFSTKITTTCRMGVAGWAVAVAAAPGTAQASANAATAQIAAGRRCLGIRVTSMGEDLHNHLLEPPAWRLGRGCCLRLQ